MAGYNESMKKLRPRVRALKLAREVRKRLAEELGQPVRVIMFGSQARGDATKESDIDLLIILPSINIRTTRLASDVAWEVGFEAGKVISAIPDTEEQMKRFAFLPFYQKIKQEGVSA
jgi:predicted nucleotidyltransferase